MQAMQIETVAYFGSMSIHICVPRSSNTTIQNLQDQVRQNSKNIDL
jgi:hypothetical protein